MFKNWEDKIVGLAVSIRSILFIVDISLMIKKNDWEVDCLWSYTFHPVFRWLYMYLFSLPPFFRWRKCCGVNVKKIKYGAHKRDSNISRKVLRCLWISTREVPLKSKCSCCLALVRSEKIWDLNNSFCACDFW